MIEHLKGRERALSGPLDGPDGKRNGSPWSVSTVEFSRGRSSVITSIPTGNRRTVS